jgi:hypothetical protein
MSFNIPSTFGELRNMSDAELRAAYDQRAPHVQAGVDFILTELNRRTAERAQRWMIGLTIAIAVLTLVNVGLVAWTIFESDDSSNPIGTTEVRDQDGD